MSYDFSKAMSNIQNIVVALNEGGALTCDMLMNRIWDNAPDRVRISKIEKPTDVTRHSEEYARRQLRQEIRRSLYSHFNDVERAGVFISRAEPLHSAELFWVVEFQEISIQVPQLPSDHEGDTVILPGITGDYDGDTPPEHIICSDPTNLMEYLIGVPEVRHSISTALNEEFRTASAEEPMQERIHERIEGILNELSAGSVS